jgi:DNA-binding transcriptional ArsR family regulator
VARHPSVFRLSWGCRRLVADFLSALASITPRQRFAVTDDGSDRIVASGLAGGVGARPPGRLPDPQEPVLVAKLRALGDPTRWKAVELMAGRPRSTQELARLLCLSEPTVSKHLRQLSKAGIIEPRREGYFVLYRLVEESFASLSAGLLEVIAGTEPGSGGSVPDRRLCDPPQY